MTNQKETAAFGSSVGADERQTIHKCTDNSISVCNENIKGFEEMQKELLQGLNCKFKFHPSVEFNPANLPTGNHGI